MFKAILSENQKEEMFNTKVIISAIAKPVVPPKAKPRISSINDKLNSKIQVLKWSFHIL